MGTRLVLVGMVAALGISVRTWSEIRSGILAVHFWTAAQLAAWDAPTRSDWHRFDVAPPPEWRPTMFDPIVADDGASGLADDLNRAAEGLDLHPQPMTVHRRANGREQERGGARRSRVGCWSLPAADTLESRMLAELWIAAAGPDREVRSTGAPLPSRRGAASIPPTLCRFTASLLETSPTPRMIPTSVRIGPDDGRIPPKWDPIEAAMGAELGLAWELNRFGEGIPASTLGRPRPSSRPAFEPITPETSIETDTASSLNRASEGVVTTLATSDPPPSLSPGRTGRLGPTPPASFKSESPSTAGASPDLARAIRLTREAARAWLRVMKAPSGLQLSTAPRRRGPEFPPEGEPPGEPASRGRLGGSLARPDPAPQIRWAVLSAL